MQIARTPFRGALHGSDSKPQAHEHAAVHLSVSHFRTNKLYLIAIDGPRAWHFTRICKCADTLHAGVIM